MFFKNEKLMNRPMLVGLSLLFVFAITTTGVSQWGSSYEIPLTPYDFPYDFGGTAPDPVQAPYPYEDPLTPYDFGGTAPDPVQAPYPYSGLTSNSPYSNAYNSYPTFYESVYDPHDPSTCPECIAETSRRRTDRPMGVFSNASGREAPRWEQRWMTRPGGAGGVPSGGASGGGGGIRSRKATVRDTPVETAVNKIAEDIYKDGWHKPPRYRSIGKREVDVATREKLDMRYRPRRISRRTSPRVNPSVRNVDRMDENRYR